MARWDDVLDFLDWFVKYGPPAALILAGLLAFYFREKLKQLLSLDLERVKGDLARQQAEAVAGFQRELEAYKVSLIAEVERTKATQDVLKVLAVKVAESRFTAIHALSGAMAGIDIEASAMPTYVLPPSQEQQYMTWRGGLIDRCSALAAAMDKAAPFLTLEDRAVFARLRREVADSLDIRPSLQHPVVERGDARLASIIDAGIQCERAISRLLHEFESMVTPTRR